MSDTGMPQLVYQTGMKERNEVDAAEFPWKLYGNFSPPEFMIVAFIGLYGGSEEIEVRTKSLGDLEKFLQDNRLRTHPRLRYLEITSPDGKVERIDRVQTAV